MIKEWNVCYYTSQVEITSQQAKDRRLSIMKTRHVNKILKHTSLQKNYMTIKEIIIDQISLQIKLWYRRYWCKKYCCLKKSLNKKSPLCMNDCYHDKTNQIIWKMIIPMLLLKFKKIVCCAFKKSLQLQLGYIEGMSHPKITFKTLLWMTITFMK
jgi:hypothetical protein